VKPEGPGQVLPAVAEHLDPHIGEAIARSGHGAGSPAAGQGFPGEVRRTGYFPEEHREIGAPAAEPEALLFQPLCLLAKALHEGTAPQDALVGEVALPASAEGLDGLPATLRSSPPPWRSGRRPWGTPAATKAR
jgi:hypothetical protein